jgi:hypothetical protein
LGLAINQLELKSLDRDSALDLLSTLIGKERVEKDIKTAQEVCEWLGSLPLGIELFGRYLNRKPDLSLKSGFRRLQTKRFQSPSISKPEADMTSQSGLFDAFNLSWTNLTTKGHKLGCLLSLFALAQIPWPLVEECFAGLDDEELEDIRDEQLINLHLLQRKKRGYYQLHQLIREFFSDKLLELKGSENLKHSYCQAILKHSHQITEFLNRRQVEELGLLIPHLDELVTKLTNHLSDEELIVPFRAIGLFYEAQGFYDKAENWYSQCLSTCERRLGESHLETARAISFLASN